MAPPSLPPLLPIARSLSTSALAARMAAAAPTLSPVKKNATALARSRSGAPPYAQLESKRAPSTPSLCSVKRDDLLCSICFDILCFPVTLPCGHNFDRGCILAAWRYDASVSDDRRVQHQPQHVQLPPGWTDVAPEPEDPRHAHLCPLCRHEAGISNVNELQVNLLLKDVIAKLYPIETECAATLEKQLSAARVVANASQRDSRSAQMPSASTASARPRYSFRAISSFAYVCVASVTDPPGFVLAVLLLLGLLAIACNPQHVLASNASAGSLTLIDVLDRVFSGFSVLIREFSLTLDQLQQLKPWLHAFSIVV